MQISEITRSFKYNSVGLPDPNPSLGPDDVRQFYATQYPELLNAVVEGPTTKAGVATYTFTRAAGAKGATNQASASSTTGRPAETLVERALQGVTSDGAAVMMNSANDKRYITAAASIAAVASAPRGGASMALPSSAFGIFG